MHTFPFIFIPLHSSNSSIPLLYEDSHPDSPNSHVQFPAFHSYYPHSHPDSLHSHHFHPDSSYSHPGHRISIIPTLILRIPIIPFIPFPDSPFRLLQIAPDAFSGVFQ